MRELALDTPSTAIVIVIRTGKTVPLVMPITRVRDRLELCLRFVDRRTTLFRVDPSKVTLVALDHERDYLFECRVCFGRVWLLLEDGRKVYMSGNRHSQNQVTVKRRGSTHRNRPQRAGGSLCALVHAENVPS